MMLPDYKSFDFVTDVVKLSPQDDDGLTFLNTRHQYYCHPIYKWLIQRFHWYFEILKRSASFEVTQSEYNSSSID